MNRCDWRNVAGSNDGRIVWHCVTPSLVKSPVVYGHCSAQFKVTSQYSGRKTEVLLYERRSGTYQCEEDEEARDVADHAAEWDLQGPEHLEGRHQVRRPGDTHDVRDGEQHVRHDLRVVRLPLEPRWNIQDIIQCCDWADRGYSTVVPPSEERNTTQCCHRAGRGM